MGAASSETGRTRNDALDPFGALSGPFPRELVRASASLTRRPVPAYGPSFAKQAIVWVLRHLPPPVVDPVLRFVRAVWPRYAGA